MRQSAGPGPRPRVREIRELARVRALPPHTSGITNIFGFPVEFTHGESFAAHYRPIFQLEQYALPNRLTGPDAAPRIIDCGANIGLASIYWTRVAPECRITAFEPDPQLAAVLRRNLHSARAAHVEVVEAAAWTEAGLELRFWHQGAGGGRLAELSRLDLRPEEEAVARTVRLHDYLVEDWDVVKIDIEGAETDVLLDCSDLLGKIPYLFVEYHSFADQPQRLVELLAVLRDSGFRVHVESESQATRPWANPRAASGIDLQLNIFASRD